MYLFPYNLFNDFAFHFTVLITPLVCFLFIDFLTNISYYYYYYIAIIYLPIFIMLIFSLKNRLYNSLRNEK